MCVTFEFKPRRAALAMLWKALWLNLDAKIARNRNYATNVVIDSSTVCRELYKHGCTRKEIVHVAIAIVYMEY